MSGAFGWHRNTQTNNQPTHVDQGGFTDAARAYQTPPKAVRIGPSTPTPPPSRQSFHQAATSAIKLPIPTALHALKSTAQNVLIVVNDVTGSMGNNLEEIFRRLP